MSPRLTRHATLGRTVALGSGAAVLVLVPALTACTSSTSGPDVSTTAPGASTSTTTVPTALPSGVTPADIPTSVANVPDDRKNVALTGCAKVDGGWGATGTATNPGQGDVTYTVTVFFTTTAATTVDSASTKVTVPAGQTKEWKADKTFTAAPEMLCVLRGVAKG